MALFNKPPAKKPDAQPPIAKPAADPGAPRSPVSARDVAAPAQGRRGSGDMPRAERQSRAREALASEMDAGFTAGGVHLLG